jgi:hypothetical protein
MRIDNPSREQLAAYFQRRVEYRSAARALEVPFRHLKFEHSMVACDAY